MRPLPPRPSLVVHSARFLRELIEAGEWRGFLPSERTLCSRLAISRPTLRAALAQLEEDGILGPVENKRRVLPPLAGAKKKEDGRASIALLSPMPLHAMPPFVLLWVDQLRTLLANEGVPLQVHVGRAEFAKRSPQKALDTLVATFPDTTWVLYQSTETMQRWFAKTGHRCVVVGSLPPDLALPSVDRDYRAACRHAVGLMAARGHRDIALLIQKTQLGGDVASRDGFEEGLKQIGGDRLRGRVWHHEGSSKSIGEAMQAMLSSPRRPSALLVARSAYALTAVSHLLSERHRIPEDMALICRDDDAFLDHLVPRITRYTVNPGHFAKQVYRLIKNPRATTCVQVMPALLERESL